jgi:hypothetical protein
MEENIRAHVGAVVFAVISSSETTNKDVSVVGRLMGPFAKAGKCKVELLAGVSNGTQILEEGSELYIDC